MYKYTNHINLNRQVFANMLFLVFWAGLNRITKKIAAGIKKEKYYLRNS